MELYLHRASASSKGSEEQKTYAKLALAEMDSLDELANAATEDAALEDSQGLSFNAAWEGVNHEVCRSAQ